MAASRKSSTSLAVPNASTFVLPSVMATFDFPNVALPLEALPLEALPLEALPLEALLLRVALHLRVARYLPPELPEPSPGSPGPVLPLLRRYLL